MTSDRLAKDEGKGKRRIGQIREYEPFGAFPGFDELFGNMARTMLPRRFFGSYFNESLKAPAVDIEDTGNSLIIKVDMPGVNKKSIHLNVNENSITVSAQKSSEEERKGKSYYARERSSMGYYRVVGLPEKIKSNTARAKLENGTLRIEAEKLNRSEATSVKVE